MRNIFDDPPPFANNTAGYPVSLEDPCRVSSFSLYGNVTLLDAEFTSGPNNGNTPAYAPEYQVKTGGIYRYKNIFKIALLGTLVDDEFGDDGNSFEGFIPAYNVWDLTAEVKF